MVSTTPSPDFYLPDDQVSGGRDLPVEGQASSVLAPSTEITDPKQTLHTDLEDRSPGRGQALVKPICTDQGWGQVMLVLRTC